MRRRRDESSSSSSGEGGGGKAGGPAPGDDEGKYMPLLLMGVFPPTLGVSLEAMHPLLLLLLLLLLPAEGVLAYAATTVAARASPLASS